MAKLLIQENTGVREFELVDNETQIGRELDNALRLADPSISRHHAVLRRTADGYEIQDLGSSNGVLVNGAKVQVSPLRDGDRLTLGQLQIDFTDPRPPQEAEAPDLLGTVRITPEEMRRVQAAQGTPAGLPAIPSAPVLEPPPLESAPAAPEQLPPPPPPQLPIPPMPPRAAGTTGEDTALSLLAGWLPPLPDDAEPLLLDGVPERGDFLTRLLAALIDGAPIVAIVVIFLILRFVCSLIPGVRIIAGCLLPALQAIICLAYSFFFMPWCWSTYGATPGKKLMKLRVVPEEDPCGRVDLGTAYLRLLGHVVNGCLLGLPYLMILGSERKSLQDMFSKSVCIKVDR